MKNLFNKRCPYCKRKSIEFFQWKMGYIHHRCSNCNGRVRMYEREGREAFRRVYFVCIFVIACLFLPSLGLDQKTSEVILVFGSMVILISDLFLLPVVAVPEKEGDVSKEKKD